MFRCAMQEHARRAHIPRFPRPRERSRPRLQTKPLGSLSEARQMQAQARFILSSGPCLVVVQAGVVGAGLPAPAEWSPAVRRAPRGKQWRRGEDGAPRAAPPSCSTRPWPPFPRLHQQSQLTTDIPSSMRHGIPCANREGDHNLTLPSLSPFQNPGGGDASTRYFHHQQHHQDHRHQRAPRPRLPEHQSGPGPIAANLSIAVPNLASREGGFWTTPQRLDRGVGCHIRPRGPGGIRWQGVLRWRSEAM